MKTFVIIIIWPAFYEYNYICFPKLRYHTHTFSISCIPKWKYALIRNQLDPAFICK